MSSGDNDPKTMAAQAMKDPQIMAAIQEKLAGLEGMRSTFYDALPKKIKSRVNACRNLQKNYVDMEAEFYHEINQLEKRYHEKFSELYNKRSEIVNGQYEPKEEECVHSGDEDEEESGEQDSEEKNGDMEMNENGEAMIRLPSAFPDDAPGVPEFWLTVLKSASHTDALIEPHDEEVLKHCTNLVLKYEDEKTIEMADTGEESPTIGFSLQFHFAKNDYFSNDMITKTYRLRVKPEKEALLAYEGPEIVQCTGCDIFWKSSEKNVTQKTIKKKQKNKKTGQTRSITQVLPQDSFFNFFQPIESKVENMRKILAEQNDEMDEDEFDQQAAMLEADYEIGHFIRERLIPRAVLYYTGELDDEESEDEYDDECEDPDEEYDEEQDPDFDPSKVAEKPDCKQQ
jgi:nucleosome assembly protein 1-like 1